MADPSLIEDGSLILCGALDDNDQPHGTILLVCLKGSWGGGMYKLLVWLGISSDMCWAVFLWLSVMLLRSRTQS
eukprot:3911016-Amphidinium_carterae.1